MPKHRTEGKAHAQGNAPREDEERRRYDHIDVERAHAARVEMEGEDVIDVGVRSSGTGAHDARRSPATRSGSNGAHYSGTHSRRTSAAGASARNANSKRASRKVDFSADPWEEERTEREREARERAARQRERDEFGMDDLPPMPGVQKIVLFVVVLLVVIGGYYLIRFWIG